jgi:calcineurin-like phosphoesterase family protein
MDYLTSDLHFYHRNVIQYCNRPFKDRDEMNEKLLNNINETVSYEDTLHVLGDFAFAGVKKHSEILSRIVAHKKILYTGNHDWDKKPEKLLSLGWTEVKEGWTDWEYKGIKFRLCHFPFAEHDHTDHIRYKEFRPPREGCDWLLCGHIHTLFNVMGNQINVGCDAWGFKPLSMDYIVAVTKTLDGTEVDDEILKRIYAFKPFNGREDKK